MRSQRWLRLAPRPVGPKRRTCPRDGSFADRCAGHDAWSNRSPVILTPIRVRVTTLGPTGATILTIRVEQNPFDLPSSGGNGTS